MTHPYPRPVVGAPRREDPAPHSAASRREDPAPHSAPAPHEVTCVACGGGMTQNEAALNRKYVNRATTEYLCPVCLGERLGIPPDRLRASIRTFQLRGCTLFSPLEE